MSTKKRVTSCLRFIGAAANTPNCAYASREPDPRKACPAGLPIGTGLGEFKFKGTLPMTDAVPLLGTGRAADVTKLFDAAGEYLEENHGA